MTHQYQNIREEALAQLKDKLSPIFKYHSFDHTKDMLKVVEEYIRPYDISAYEEEMLRIAIIFHDMGFIENWKDHEETSCRMAETAMTKHNYKQKDIDLIKSLIVATRMPQEPNNVLESIICDIDLDYLGRPDYSERSELLYQ